MKCKALVLAAGKGSRLLVGDDITPKPLHLANGKPIIEYVLEGLSFMEPQDITIVVGYMHEMMEEYLAGRGYNTVLQMPQHGTGHAVKLCAPDLADYDGAVLVCFGDTPLIMPQTYQRMVRTLEEENADCTVLVADLKPMTQPYGRIVRDADGSFVTVVEDSDCTPEQKLITEVNVGIDVFNWQKILPLLEQMSNDNRKKEYYITHMPGIVVENGGKTVSVSVADNSEILGINTPEDLQEVERILNIR